MNISKFCIVIFIFLSNISSAQISILSQSKSRISNPDRGFRYEAMAEIPDYKNPWGPYYLNSNTWLKFSEADFDAKDGHIRLGQLYIYLTKYENIDVLPDEALKKIEKLLSDARLQGYSLVLRFAYTYDRPEGQVYPSMSRILAHVEQLAPILKENNDVISVLQAGFIGLWGEWHSDNNIYSNQDKSLLISKLFSTLPKSMVIQMRLPDYKNKLNIDENLKRRIGFHNDYFADSSLEYSLTINGFLNSKNFQQVSEESKYTWMDGELPYTITSKSGNSYLIPPIEVAKQLRANHYSSFSVVHNYNENIANWKKTKLTKKDLDSNDLPYDPDYLEGDFKTYYDYITDYLGYRLFFNYNNSNIKFDNVSGYINYSLSLSNYGFTSVMNPRDLFLIVLDSKNEILVKQKLAINFKSLGSKETQILRGKIAIKKNIKKYKVGLWLPSFPQSKSYYTPNYSIKISNTNWIEIKLDENRNILFNEIFRNE